MHQISILNDPVSVRIMGPGGQRTGGPCFRIEAVAVGGLHLLRFHHVIPAPFEIGALIVETDPQERCGPRGISRGLPLFHRLIAMLTSGYILFGHIFSYGFCRMVYGPSIFLLTGFLNLPYTK